LSILISGSEFEVETVEPLTELLIIISVCMRGKKKKTIRRKLRGEGEGDKQNTKEIQEREEE
jgi:hypothetical protein